jgi:hypothetical protein
MKKIVQVSCLTVSFSFIALFVCQTDSVATSVQTPVSQSQLIDALDDCIQERFKDIDKAFGLRRLMRAGDTPHRFKPENTKELASLSELKSRKIEAALYLTSRSVLGDKPDAIEWNQGADVSPVGSGIGYSRRIIKGPVLINARGRDDLPLPSELWEQSRKAIEIFATQDSFEFSYGKWNFIARPVRASEQSCLQCHVSDSTRLIAQDPKDGKIKPLKIGDPLGVVLYAYREGR